jgi:hypothetical protein
MKHPRLIRHETAYAYMRAGSFNLAILELKDSISENGPNILSLIDLAASYHGAHDYDNFTKYSNIAYEEYQKCLGQLSNRSKYQAALGLGRLLEDSGRLALAMKTFNEYLDLPFSDIELAYKRSIECELMRAYSMIGNREKTAHLYMNLLQPSSVNEKVKVDLEHSLILAECQNIGFESAMKRWNRIKTEMTTLDKRLIFFDFVFELILNKDFQRLPIEAFSDFLYLECDPFEKGVWDLFLSLQGLEPQLPLELQRSDEMSPLCSIRYLAVLDLFNLRPDLEIELRNKLNLLLLALDPQTRKMVSNIWRTEKTSVKIQILQEDVAGPNGISVSLKKQQKIVQFLHYVLDSQPATADALSMHLFELEFSESTEARLRSLIVRINKIFEIHFGVVKAFTLSKAEISVSSAFEMLDRRTPMS